MTTRSETNGLDTGEREILKAIAGELREYAYNATPMPGWLAAARSEQLRRIADGQIRPMITEAQLREKAVALSYSIRRKLSPRTPYKKHAGEVADLYGVSDQVVTSRASKHKDYVKAWLAKMPANVEYGGLSLDEMLKRELASIEEPLLRRDKKR